MNLILQRLNLLPRLQPSPHRPQLKLLQENRTLIHPQQHIPRYLLVTENIAVRLLHPRSSKMLSNLRSSPLAHLRAIKLPRLLLIRLRPINI